MDRWTETQSLTRTAFSLTDKTLGLSLEMCSGIRIAAAAPSGANIVNLNGMVWFWENSWATWVRSLDFDIARLALNVPAIVFPDLPIIVPDGRIFISSSGSTVSAGSTITWLVKTS
jgi:hypothetical protein